MRVSAVMRRSTAAVGTAVLAAGMALASPIVASAAPGDSPSADSSSDTTVQILGINDFHGRIDPDFDSDIAGASVLAGAIKQLRGDNPNTVVAGAGDLIGASIFASFIADDVPTIDALDAAGVQVSSVGNHEFDQGITHLKKFVQPKADWPYLGANVVSDTTGKPELPATWTTTVDGVKVGFVGAVTQHLKGLVSPAGIKGITVTNIAKATNAAADKLTKDGAQIVILLVHEGYATTDCKNLTDPNSDLGQVIADLDGNVDAVISGHTHLAYNCTVPVKQRSQTDDPALPLPVMQSGKYGANLDQLNFTVDSDGTVTKIDHQLVPLVKTVNGKAEGAFPPVAAVTKIVDAADANAKVLGAKPIGKISGPYNRAKTADGTENRGGESNLGNLVAEAQLTMTKDESTPAQIVFMNPGGLRADMHGDNANGYPANVSYKAAADVQPFGDKLDIMTLTGSQIKTVLEEQWQPKGASRPMLHLGASKGFTWTYDPTAAKNHHITGMWLNGTPIDLKANYTVGVNDFLAAGGDQFFELANGKNVRQTGRVDLQTFVEYMKQATAKKPLPMDSSQRSVGIAFPSDAPKSYEPGDKVTFHLSSLAFPAPKGSTEPVDTEVTVKLGDDVLGTFPVNNSPTTEPNDETGTADVSVTLPKGTDAGTAVLTISGNHTGTTTQTDITVKAVLASTGTPAYEMAGVAFLLLMLGGGLLVTTRKRRQRA